MINLIPVTDYVIPQTRSEDDLKWRTIKRKIIQDIRKEIPAYTDPIYSPPPKPAEIPLHEIPRKLMDLDNDIDTEENSPIKKVLYQKHIKDQIAHIFKNHQNWIVSLAQLVQKFLSK